MVIRRSDAEIMLILVDERTAFLNWETMLSC